MNNKLIAGIQKHRNRISVLQGVIPQIEYLVKHGDIFTKNDSITALNKIKEYLVKLKDEQKNGYVITKKMRRELRDSCIHDVLIKKSNYYECCICGECFKLDDINFNCFLVEILENNPIFYYIIPDIINEIAIQDEDIFSVFEDRICDKYKIYDGKDNLLVYRRSR